MLAQQHFHDLVNDARCSVSGRVFIGYVGMRVLYLKHGVLVVDVRHV